MSSELVSANVTHPSNATSGRIAWRAGTLEHGLAAAGQGPRQKQIQRVDRDLALQNEQAVADDQVVANRDGKYLTGIGRTFADRELAAAGDFQVRQSRGEVEK